jgi:hypothetical protein
MPCRSARWTRQTAAQAAAVCGATVTRRAARPASAVSPAWLVVLPANPADAADTGCLLRFLCMAVAD